MIHVGLHSYKVITVQFQLLKIAKQIYQYKTSTRHLTITSKMFTTFENIPCI